MTELQTAAALQAHPLRDSLTKALSRQQFFKCLAEEIERASKSGIPFALCLLDVDCFRNVNETHGYLVGDAVLAELAGRIRARLDEPDLDDIEYLHGRFDGDSIVLLARDCSSKQGRRLAEELRASVNAEPLANRVMITVTVGVVEFLGGENLASILGRLEKTVFLAKQFGSDRVEVAPTPENALCSNVVPLPRRGPMRRRRISNAQM